VTRFSSSDNQAAAARPDVYAAICADLALASGTLRLNDSEYTFPINGNTYTGLGRFGSIEHVEESTDMVARPVRLSLSGVDSSLIAEALPDTDVSNYQNRAVTLRLALFVPSTYQLVDTPEILWEGRMNQMVITLGADQSQIALSCEHRLRRAPRIARYTNEDQQLLYPGDRFFDLLPQIPGFRGTWGSQPVGVQAPARSSREQFIRDMFGR